MQEPVINASGYSVKMSGSPSETVGSPLAGIYRGVPATPNATYALTGQSFRYYDSSADWVGFQFCSSVSCNSVDWRPLYGKHGIQSWAGFSESITAPSDAKNLNVYLAQGYNQSAGGDLPNDVYFDNISLQSSISFTNNAGCSPTVIFPPNPATSGQRYSLSVPFVNQGNTTWTSGNGYNLVSANPQGNSTWGLSTVSLGTQSVPPGGTGAFNFTVTTRLNPGTYPFYWQMAPSGTAFGGQCYTSITVPSVNSAGCWAIAPPPNPTVAGQRYTVSAQMINQGTTTWTSGANYHLGSQNSQDNTTWGVTRVNLSGEPVPPGGIGTFTFDVTAPSTPGSYPWYWRMVQDGVEWFGGQCYTTISPVATYPTATISEPANNSSFTVGQAVPISALAEDTDGLLSKGEILVNGSVISTSNFTGGTSRSFSTGWTPSLTGTYTITAKAYDSAGLSATSNAVSVTINQKPAVASPPAPIISSNYNCIKTPNRGDELTLTWTNPPGVPAVTSLYASSWPNFYPYHWYSAASGTTGYAPSPFGWRYDQSTNTPTWTWNPLTLTPDSKYYFRLYNGNSYNNYAYAWGPVVEYKTPKACAPPSIESPGIDSSNSSTSVSFNGKARYSGRQVAESGSNWLNGQVFSMKAHPGNAGNAVYYLGLYNASSGYISSYSNFVSSMQSRSSDPRSAILLAYGNWGEWFVYDGVTYQWGDLSKLGRTGYNICGSENRGNCNDSNSYYRVVRGNDNQNVSGGSALPYTWTIYFNSPLTTQAMYTASYVTDSNLYNVFQADTTPNSPGQ